MGAVYRAVQTRLDKVVALKVLAPKFAENKRFLARFEREMKAVGKLEHPHIVRAMDAGEFDGVTYLAMEYVAGSDVKAYVQAKGRLSVVNACKVIRQAAMALAAAHQAGLIHRDIKPANLLISKTGQVKILDLGLALLGSETEEQTDLTGEGQTFGTPDYMAPEQWENAHQTDGRADLYALGCTLYFCLTGRAPYGTEEFRTTVAKLRAHLMAPIPPLPAVCPEVPPELEAIYQRLMAKQPADRIQTAGELARLLEPFCSRQQSSQSGVLSSSGVLALAEAVKPSGGAHAETVLMNSNSSLPVLQLPPQLPGSGGSQRFHKRPAAAAPASRWMLWGGGVLALAAAIGVAYSLVQGRNSGGDGAAVADVAEEVAQPAAPVEVAEEQKPAAAVEAEEAFARFNNFITPDPEAAAQATGEMPAEGTPAEPAPAENLAATAPATPPPPVLVPPERRLTPLALTPLPFPRGLADELLEKAPLPPLRLKPGTPISAPALVSQPAPIKELASWSVELLSHASPIYSLHVSPDGRRLVTAAADDTIRIWRIIEPAQPGEELQIVLEKILLGDSGQLSDVQWSPDGSMVACISYFAPVVTVYGANTGQILRRFELPSNRGIRLLWSADSRLIAALRYFQASLLDVVSGRVLHSNQSFSHAQDLAWSPAGHELAVIDQERNLYLLEVPSLQLIKQVRELPISSGNISVDYTPDGRSIVVGGNSVLALLDAKTYRVLRSVEAKPLGASHILFEKTTPPNQDPASGGPRLLVGSGGGAIWDAQLRQPVLTGISADLVGADWSPDGRRIYFLRNLAHPAALDPQTGSFLGTAELLGRPAYEAPNFDVSNDGKTLRLISRSDLLLFNAETGEYVRRYANLPGGWIAASPKDDWLVVYHPGSGGEGTEIAITFVDTATHERRISLTGHSDVITAVNWSPDGTMLASSSLDRTARIWKVGESDSLLQLAHPREVRTVCWSPDGRHLATVATDNIVRIWSAASGSLEGEITSLTNDTAWGPAAMAWSPARSALAVASHSGMSGLLDLNTGSYREISGDFQCSQRGVAWSPDGKQILFSSWCNELAYGSAITNGLVRAEGHNGPMEWLPDSRRVITGQNGSRPLQAVDTRTGQRLGILYPEMSSGGWLAIGADGHYRGSAGIEKEIAYVALLKDGTQLTLTPGEFEAKYGWKNDPAKATFLKLRDPRRRN
jgi:serine/threonine protein kinase/WD40 repeat protein